MENEKRKMEFQSRKVGRNSFHSEMKLTRDSTLLVYFYGFIITYHVSPHIRKNHCVRNIFEQTEFSIFKNLMKFLRLMWLNFSLLTTKFQTTVAKATAMTTTKSNYFSHKVKS